MRGLRVEMVWHGVAGNDPEAVDDQWLLVVHDGDDRLGVLVVGNYATADAIEAALTAPERATEVAETVEPF